MNFQKQPLKSLFQDRPHIEEKLLEVKSKLSRAGKMETKEKRSSLDSEAQIPKEPQCPPFIPLQINRAQRRDSPTRRISKCGSSRSPWILHFGIKTLALLSAWTCVLEQESPSKKQEDVVPISQKSCHHWGVGTRSWRYWGWSLESEEVLLKGHKYGRIWR